MFDVRCSIGTAPLKVKRRRQGRHLLSYFSFAIGVGELISDQLEAASKPIHGVFTCDLREGGGGAGRGVYRL